MKDIALTKRAPAKRLMQTCGNGVLAAAIMSAAPVAAQSDIAPVNAPWFRGVVKPDVDSSTPDFPRLPTAPAGAPNVILVMTDDVGFAATSTFGGPVATPTLDALAAAGVKYNRFHTTAMCSPSRAALLTGRNAHAVGTGTLVDFANGFPGYTSIIPKSAATIAEMLRDKGYNTAFFGKNHNIPSTQMSAAGPFDLWPTSTGFDYFYGFLASDANQHSPVLYRGTDRLPEGTGGRLLDARLADDAIRWIHNQKAAAPDKPFFIYLAPGSAHTPHQAPEEWLARFRGRFDTGWDALREDILARQIRLGVVPRNTRLTSRPAGIPPWASLSNDERRLQARQMEAFAAMLAYQDHALGRVFGEVERMGLKGNTIVVFVEGDNGPDAAGGRDGSFDEVGEIANKPLDTAWKIARIDDIGTDRVLSNYSAGWAWAMSTPFPYFKQIASHLGGTRNGLVISWPDRIAARGVRAQYHHLIDIVPTILELTGVNPPQTVQGVRQQAIDGVSMVYSLAHPEAADRRHTQYYETLGNRAIYHDGWLAATTPAQMPWDMGKKPSGTPPLGLNWELYDLRRDFSQSRDVAAKHPGRLAEMKMLFDSEARKYNVYPLDSRVMARSGLLKKAYVKPRSSFVYWGKDISVAEADGPELAGTSFSATAEITLAQGQRDGVIFATGSHFGGWAFYIHNGRPAVTHALSQMRADQSQVIASETLGDGPARISFRFVQDTPGLGKGGVIRLYIGDREVASKHIERTLIKRTPVGETFDIGFDGGAPVVQGRGVDRFDGEITRLEIRIDGAGDDGSNLSQR